MRLISWKDERAPDSAAAHYTVLFGHGLIGRSIEHALAVQVGSTSRHLDYDWSNAKHRRRQREDLINAIIPAQGTATNSTLNVIWAAGSSGFGSTQEQMSHEAGLLAEIVGFCQDLNKRSPNARITLHHISSAGGLFEGQTHCAKNGTPGPLRPYGHGKLTQERLAVKANGPFRCAIYRPSSVYGFYPGARLGLISALVRNALTNRVTRITGTVQTIRDYVFNEDIGAFIAQRIIQDSVRSTPVANEVTPVLLASGKPASMYEIISLVEDIMQRKVYLEYDTQPANAMDMSFLPSNLPQGWQPTPLHVGIFKTAQRMREHFSSH